MTPTFPKLRWPLDRNQFDSLQKCIDQMRDVFTRNISFRENLACDVVTFDFRAGSTPTKIVTNASRPLGVMPFSLQQIDPASNTPPSIAKAFDWTFDSKAKSLSFPSYGTIAGTALYRATVLVVRS